MWREKAANGERLVKANRNLVIHRRSACMKMKLNHQPHDPQKDALCAEHTTFTLFWSGAHILRLSSMIE